MTVSRVRSQTLSEGDWVTLNETLRDLAFSVNQLVDLSSSGPLAYSASISLQSAAPQISVPLDGGGLYEWSLAGVGDGATIFIGTDAGGTVSWANWSIVSSITRTTGSGAFGVLGFASGTDRTVVQGVVASGRDGWAYSGIGKLSNTTGRLVSGQSDRQLGRLLQFSGGFKAGTVLSVRKVG